MRKPKSKKARPRPQTGKRSAKAEKKKASVGLKHPRLRISAKEQPKNAGQHPRGPIKPFTPEQIRGGRSHEAIDIEFAEESALTISLRRKRNEAFVVGCYCAFCSARRSEHWGQNQNP
jgi:hypothetical protein